MLTTIFQTAFPTPDSALDPKNTAETVSNSEIFQGIIGMIFVIGMFYVLFGTFYYFYIASANHGDKEASKKRIKTGITLIVVSLGVHLVVNGVLQLLGN